MTSKERITLAACFRGLLERGTRRIIHGHTIAYAPHAARGDYQTVMPSKVQKLCCRVAAKSIRA